MILVFIQIFKPKQLPRGSNGLVYPGNDGFNDSADALGNVLEQFPHNSSGLSNQLKRHNYDVLEQVSQVRELFLKAVYQTTNDGVFALQEGNEVFKGRTEGNDCAYG